MNENLKAYKDAWKKLRDEVLVDSLKTSWGREELKKKMDQILIECLEAYLED